MDPISNAKIRASPAKHIQPVKANAASHAALGEPSDGSGEYEHTDYLDTQMMDPSMQQTNMIDPFDRVLLLKYIDNAILTSFRTLSKQNNVISHTLKVVHTRFTPIGINKRIQKAYRKAHSALYPVSEAEGKEASSGDELEIKQEEAAIVR